MENPLKLKRIHHVEFWVGNARQSAYFYRQGFGFSQVAYSGLETGQRQRASYALSQGKANFILTTPMTPDDLAADHIRKHGDGVRDIALEVEVVVAEVVEPPIIPLRLPPEMVRRFLRRPCLWWRGKQPRLQSAFSPVTRI